MTPPIDWFRDPQLDGPTPVTVTPEGRVFGHIATWDTAHVGMPGKNVRPPRSRADYGYFNTGVVEADDNGTAVDVSAGRLTLDTGHAPLTSDASDAASHYDNTGTVVANVTAGEDAHGIWFSGAVAPGVDDLKRHKLKSSSVSGDWRPIDGSLELVAALMVNSGGFPIPRARVASAAELVPLVAAGIVPNPQESDMPETTSTIAKGDYVELVASGAIGQVVETGDKLVVELPVGADEVKRASEEQALAASAARTERQRLSSLEARIEQLTASLEAREIADQAAALLADIED
jgi:hypothetical protein